jgi:hypothetical protein
MKNRSQRLCGNNLRGQRRKKPKQRKRKDHGNLQLLQKQPESLLGARKQHGEFEVIQILYRPMQKRTGLDLNKLTKPLEIQESELMQLFLHKSQGNGHQRNHQNFNAYKKRSRNFKAQLIS